MRPDLSELKPIYSTTFRRLAVAGMCVFGLVAGAIAKSPCSDVYLPVSMAAGGPYQKVVTVGHSLGSMTAWTEAHLFNDVDGIISTGAAHPLGNMQGMTANTVPALTDARLAPYVGVDAGYTTTAPGSRGPLFY